MSTRGRARKRRSARRITRSGSHGDRVERVEADGGLGDGQSAGVSPDGVHVYGDRLHLGCSVPGRAGRRSRGAPRSPRAISGPDEERGTNSRGDARQAAATAHDRSTSAFVTPGDEPGICGGLDDNDRRAARIAVAAARRRFISVLAIAGGVVAALLNTRPVPRAEHRARRCDADRRTAPLSIEPTLETIALDQATFDEARTQSNRIWIAGRPLETASGRKSQEACAAPSAGTTIAAPSKMTAQATKPFPRR